MTVLAILSSLLGFLFGLRFKVFVLVPLTVSLGFIVILAAPFFHVGVIASFKVSAFCSIFLQGGYLVGSVMSFWIVAGRISRAFARPLTTTPRARATPARVMR